MREYPSWSFSRGSKCPLRRENERLSAPVPASPGSGDPVQRAQFVAVRIAQISEIELAETTLAHARRILDRGPATGDARRVPGVGLRRAHREADRAAIACGRGRAIDR